MAIDDHKQARTGAWSASMTLAVIILGVYLVSMFYMSVTDETSRAGDDEQIQALNQH